MSKHITIEKGRQPFISFTTYTDDDIEQTFELPAAYRVCGHCNGTGSSSAYLGSWTADEWSQESVEFREDYLAGVYDKPCPECGGRRVVACPDQRYRHDPKYAEIFELWGQKLKDDAWDAALECSERRMGC